MFEKWLDTAREEIEPFLQSLEEIFNKSENQIRTVFKRIPLAAPNNAGVEIFYRLTQKLPNI